jgi:hypothetical protein
MYYFFFSWELVFNQDSNATHTPSTHSRSSSPHTLLHHACIDGYPCTPNQFVPTPNNGHCSINSESNSNNTHTILWYVGIATLLSLLTIVCYSYDARQWLQHEYEEHRPHPGSNTTNTTDALREPLLHAPLPIPHNPVVVQDEETAETTTTTPEVPAPPETESMGRTGSV